VRMARPAVTAVFALPGALYGTWASRVPALAAQVDAGPGGIGLALLGISVGMIIGAPVAARLCGWWGARPVIAGSALVSCGAVPLLGLAGSTGWLGVVLLLLGLATGVLDVSMNLGAVLVVRHLDRPLMPSFHASYSVGGLFGSLTAGWAAAIGAIPLHQFLLAGALGAALTLVVTPALPDGRPEPDQKPDPDSPAAPPPWRQPLLWVLASIALCSGLAEGASADWSALFLVRDRGLSQSLAATGYAAFSLAMAISRLSGERLQRRWGPYQLLGAGAMTAAAGLFLAVLVPVGALGYVGFALAGAGLAFGFPITMGLAGAAGRRSDGSGGERELSFVTTIAYTAFLAGPPLVGGIAQAVSLSLSLGVVAVVVAFTYPATRLARRLIRTRD
jgi:MFS family permease